MSKLIDDIKKLHKESLETELLKSLSKKKETPVVIQKVPVSNRFLDNKRQEDVLYSMLEYYKIQTFKRQVEDYIKDISRSEPDFYTLKLTSDFIDTLLTEYNDKNFIKLEEEKI
jgi:hypothetical protein